MSAHSPAEWASMFCLAVSGYGAFSVPYFVLVDADLRDFDPRPALSRTRSPLWQAAVHAGHDLNRAVASIRHELVPAAVCVWHAVYGGRELARDAAALIVLLTTSPKAELR